MKKLFILVLLIPFSSCFPEPAVPGTILTFYITDDNINTEHRAVMTIPTSGLVDFTINGIPIPGPDEMVETGIDTSTFQLQLTLPDSVNGKPLKDGDVVVMTYHQQADYSGNPQTITQSRVLTSAQSGPIASSVQGVRIGRYFTLQINAPNFNLDSYVPDDIPLNMVEFRMGGLATTLADQAFHVNTGALRETGPDTGIFEATFQIPREVDGFPIEIGSSLEFRFLDPSNPSSVFVTVGSLGISIPAQAPLIPPTMIVRTTNPMGAYVKYLNSTFLNGLQTPACYPKSGSLFSIGTTTVTCSAKDEQGNSVVKTFSINVIIGLKPIPYWIKKLVGISCSGDIDDNQLQTTIQYLVSTGVIQLGASSAISGETASKSDMCLWAEGKLSDSDVTKSFYLLSR